MIVFDKPIDKDFAYFYGAFLGDGSLILSYGYAVIYARRDFNEIMDEWDFLLECKKALERWSGIKFNTNPRMRRDANCWRINLCNKEFCKFLNDFKQENILNQSEEIKTAFIQGFFDAEGCIQLSKKRGKRQNKDGTIKDEYINALRFYIGFANTDLSLLRFCQAVLNSIGISSREITYREGIQPSAITLSHNPSRKQDRLGMLIIKGDDFEKFYEKIYSRMIYKQLKLDTVFQYRQMRMQLARNKTKVFNPSLRDYRTLLWAKFGDQEKSEILYDIQKIADEVSKKMFESKLPIKVEIGIDPNIDASSTYCKVNLSPLIALCNDDELIEVCIAHELLHHRLDKLNMDSQFYENEITEKLISLGYKKHLTKLYSFVLKEKTTYLRDRLKLINDSINS